MVSRTPAPPPPFGSKPKVAIKSSGSHNRFPKVREREAERRRTISAGIAGRGLCRLRPRPCIAYGLCSELTGKNGRKPPVRFRAAIAVNGRSVRRWATGLVA
jgi:hypothetical protein